MTPITYDQVIAFLTILALLMGVIFLYNVIILALGFRRITRRVDRVSRELESIAMKPLTAVDNAMEWIIGFLDGLKDAHDVGGKKHHGKTKHKEKEKEFEVVDL